MLFGTKLERGKGIRSRNFYDEHSMKKNQTDFETDSLATISGLPNTTDHPRRCCRQLAYWNPC